MKGRRTLQLMLTDTVTAIDDKRQVFDLLN